MSSRNRLAELNSEDPYVTKQLNNRVDNVKEMNSNQPHGDSRAYANSYGNDAPMSRSNSNRQPVREHRPNDGYNRPPERRDNRNYNRLDDNMDVSRSRSERPVLTRPMEDENTRYKPSQRSPTGRGDDLPRSQSTRQPPRNLNNSPPPRSNSVRTPTSYPANDIPMNDMKRTKSTNGNGSNTDAYSAKMDYLSFSVDRIYDNMNVIEKLHSKALIEVSQEGSNKIQKRLDLIQTETDELIYTVRSTLTKLSAETKLIKGPEKSVRKNGEANMAKVLMKVADDFSKLQSSYQQKIQARAEREIKIAHPNATPDEVYRAAKDSTGRVFAQTMRNGRVQAQRQALEQVQTRHEELRKLESSIEELAQLFTDMQMLLQTQQEKIDVIDTYIEDTAVNIETGGKVRNQ
ncbi:Plasma membrane t-SNARE, secretory vesicle fusion [Globomyces sp. JEL0801]|nr:Plasma membrane t-SNARE, secretory vesicle fusion [Globomyces sp. JEL0801]